MDSGDEVTQQLKTLREGSGLTNGRLGERGELMSALGTSDVAEGSSTLQRLLAELPETEQTRALEVDYGTRVSRHLGRELTPDERTRLGRRRSAYAELIGRDVKTLQRWSDRAIADLRVCLINDTFDGHVYVVAAVENDRILGITVMQEELTTLIEQPKKRDSIDLVNPSHEPSMSCIVYGFPRDWSPASVTFVISFRSAQPTRVMAFSAPHLLQASFANNPHMMPIVDSVATCRFMRPRRDEIYCVTWSY